MKRIMLCAVVFWAFWSCTTRQVEPTRASRKAIDTLYQQKILALQPQIDSACYSIFDSLYQASVDSLMAVRKAEMEVLVK